VSDTGTFETTHWPTEIRLDPGKRALEVDFDDGAKFRLAAEYLRVESPSAEVQGHSPSQKQLVPGKARVAISSLEPVGNYAVRISFDDGHDTGLFSWKYLYQLGVEHDSRWGKYLGELAQRGLKRE
jgi:DUF971 family protein